MKINYCDICGVDLRVCDINEIQITPNSCATKHGKFQHVDIELCNKCNVKFSKSFRDFLNDSDLKGDRLLTLNGV